MRFPLVTALTGITPQWLADIERMEDDVVLTRRHNDVVLVALHNHDLSHHRAFGLQ